MKISEALYAAMAKYVRKYDSSCTEVTSHDENAYKSYGCDTCGPEYEYSVDIYYKTPNTRSGAANYTYKGRFGDLIQTLDYLSDEE